MKSLIDNLICVHISELARPKRKGQRTKEKKEAVNFINLERIQDRGNMEIFLFLSAKLGKDKEDRVSGC